MASELFYAFIGALFGVVLALVPKAVRRLRDLKYKRTADRRRYLMKAGMVNDWLLDYYQSKGVDTFICEIGGIKKAVPILTREAWISPNPVDMTSDWPIVQRPPPRNLEVDLKAIKRQEQLGTTLYETIQDSLYLDMMQPNDHALLATRPCRYFALASSLIALEDETFACAARRNRWRRRTPVRDEHLPAEPRPGERRKRPFSVGGLAVFAMRNGESYEIAIQTRSSQVLTAPNAKAIIPNFGLTENLLSGNRSKLGVLPYNFFKEYLEEMYNYEALIGNVMERRVDPDWFFQDFSEAKELLALAEQGMFTLTYLGMGIDCLSSTTVIAMLAAIEDPKFAESIKRKLKANWEVAIPRSDSPTIQFVRNDDAQLSVWLEGGEYQASSAFALALALPELNRKVKETHRAL